MRRLLAAPLLALVLSFGGAAPVAAATFDVFDKACDGVADSELCVDSGTSQGQTADNNSFLGSDGLLLKVVDLLQMVVGVAAVIMVIVGGLKYIISTGDPQKISGAKNLILYALIGLVITVAARQIILFVVSSL
jgi:hypothetical protein